MIRIALFLLAAFVASAQIPWKLADLQKTPHSTEAPNQGEAGVKAVWIDGPPFKGKPTRIFAYYGVPSTGSKKAPAMVLIHGGGGTAFAEWVRMWNSRGFAAIALDTVGTLPAKTDAKTLWNPTRARFAESGPAGWGDFSNVDQTPEEQWSYHAVAGAILAHSFLRSLPGVDPKRVGVTGISWGGYLTSIVASLDHRFRFGIPVYGCGFLGEDSAWLKDFEKMGQQRAARWLKLWDPSSYLPYGKRPMFWINGTNDFAYVMSSWQKSYRLPKGKRSLSLQVRMKHSHPDGAKPEEIFAYAKAAVDGGARLIQIRAQGERNGSMWANYRGNAVKAELNFTRDSGKWQDRKWETVAAELDANAHIATGKVPSGAKVYYLNLVDDRGLIVSAEHVGH